MSESVPYFTLFIGPFATLAACVVVITIAIMRFQSRETDLRDGWFRGLLEVIGVLMALPIQIVSFKRRELVSESEMGCAMDNSYGCALNR